MDTLKEILLLMGALFLLMLIALLPLAILAGYVQIFKWVFT